MVMCLILRALLCLRVQHENFIVFPQQAQYAKQHIKVYISMSDSDEGTDTELCVKD